MDKDTKVFLVVLVVVLTLIFMFNLGLTTGGFWWFRTPKYTGPAIKTPQTSTTISIRPISNLKLHRCYDSDYGKNYYKKGYCKIDGFNLKPIYDECSNDLLRETYCTSKNTCSFVYMNCTKGCANDGACIK